MKLYGCHNHPPRYVGHIVRHGTGEPGNAQWPWRFNDTQQCHYDQKQADEQCTGCRWRSEE